MMSNDFPSRLIELRGNKNMTQQELGDAAGVSPSQISRYEAGSAMPRKTVLTKLAAALNVSVDDLKGNLGRSETSTLILQSDSSPDLPFTVRKSDVERMQRFADVFGVSLNAMFLASLDVAKAATEGKELSIDDALRDAELFLKEGE